MNRTEIGMMLCAERSRERDWRSYWHCHHDRGGTCRRQGRRKQASESSGQGACEAARQFRTSRRSPIDRMATRVATKVSARWRDGSRGDFLNPRIPVRIWGGPPTTPWPHQPTCCTTTSTDAREGMQPDRSAKSARSKSEPPWLTTGAVLLHFVLQMCCME